MMHMHMIGISVAIAVAIRLLHRLTQPGILQSTDWQNRWQRALLAFVVPPMFLLATAVAIVIMGTRSCHAWEGWLSYLLAILFLMGAIGAWARLAGAAAKVQHEARRYSQKVITTRSGVSIPAQVMPVSAIFSAQVGLWSSALVVSEGLLARLDADHLEAVLAHEAGHEYYRDTFWFFWLGGLRHLTGWLPNTETLWQELLLLREMRADRWATNQVDALILAESLLSIVTAPLMPQEAVCAGFSCAAPRSRLAQRVDALLAEDISVGSFGLSPEQWIVLALALTPLLTIPFHH